MSLTHTPKPESLFTWKQAVAVFGLFVFILGASRCTSIKYEDDIGFLNSAQANSTEWMVTIDGKVCKDMDGEVGACTKRIKSNQSPVLKHDPRPYAYQLRIKCTEGTDIDFSQDVEANKTWSYKIEAAKIKDFKSFSCQGEIFPQDRGNSLSALWQIRFLVVDVDYEKREIIQRNSKGFLFGRYAKYARACSAQSCKDFKHKTVAGFKNGVTAYSESEVMRFNYYGY